MLNALLLLPMLTACTPKETQIGSQYARAVQEEALEDGTVLESVDINDDGRSDIFNYIRIGTNEQKILVRKEIDLNLDGVVDVISYFDESGALEREEMDGDFDAHFDWIDHYQNGQRVLAEADTDFDGKTNIFTYYQDGKVTRKERDTDGDGKIDVWEKFDAEGRVEKTGRDTDGDGKVDERDD